MIVGVWMAVPELNAKRFGPKLVNLGSRSPCDVAVSTMMAEKSEMPF
jgi:hypothetical protein